jgi:hypothetical protein
LNCLLHSLLSATGRRPNHPEKNISTDYWKNVMMSIIDNSPITRVVSFGTPIMGDTSCYRHFSSFGEWVGLLAHPNCKAVIAPCTGGVYPIFFCGHPDSKLLIIDENKLVAEHADSPSFYNPCINFTSVQLKVIDYLPGTGELSKTVLDYIL